LKKIWKSAPKGPGAIKDAYEEAKKKLPLDLQVYTKETDMVELLRQMLKPGKLLEMDPLKVAGDTILDDLADVVIQIMGLVWSETYHRFCVEKPELCSSTIQPQCKFLWECDEKLPPGACELLGLIPLRMVK